MLGIAATRLGANSGAEFSLHHSAFSQVRRILDQSRIVTVDAIIADVGVCSAQLDTPERGFSFHQDGPLDMRMNQDLGEPASALLNRLNARELADIFWKYGEERFSRRIARSVVEWRRRNPFTRTSQLAELVRRVVPRPRTKRMAIDPATRVFQALRIAVNRELEQLSELLSALPKCLRPNGRAVIISFHSLEDRLVKQAFRDRAVWDTMTSKPVRAGEEEVRNNPRARSAKLRAARLRRTP
jgi:16S rRNA (cytosine1402-N4)-methyltransferase